MHDVIYSCGLCSFQYNISLYYYTTIYNSAKRNFGYFHFLVLLNMVLSVYLHQSHGVQMCTFLLSTVFILRSKSLGHRVCIYSTLVNIAKQVSRTAVQIFTSSSNIVTSIFSNFLAVWTSSSVKCLFKSHFFLIQSKSVKLGHSRASWMHPS